jgi:cellulose synthase/poly-beta-1,6-N-acetylglucosamine synthase-like glycosyltransferase
MTTLPALLVVVVVVPVALAVWVLFVEIAAGFLTKPDSLKLTEIAIRPSVVVLIPAHNESYGLLPTLSDVTSQLRVGDRLLVVADNCSDDTAEVAEAAGAEVVKRSNLENVGKGYALDFGLRHLQDNLPQVVVVIDADCRLDADAIDQLATICMSTGRPVQARYVMSAPDGSGIGRRVAEFAWRVKNSLRPLGLAALGFPCQLMGSGMAFPRDAICSANLATGHLAEDLHLGLQLSSAGHPPFFCPTATVRSEFPVTDEAAAVQRQRWEQGHLRILSTEVISFAWTAAVTGNWRLLTLCFDAAVPPLTLLGFLVFGMLLISCLAALVGGIIAPLVVTSATLMFFGTGLFLAWLKCGRDLLPAQALLSGIPYIVGKLPAYARMIAVKGTGKWIRTDRSKPD